MDFFEGAVMLFLATLVVAVFALLGWFIYDEITADKFYLRKDSWTCSQSHQETTTILTQVGSVQVPQIYTNTICDQWTKK